MKRSEVKALKESIKDALQNDQVYMEQEEKMKAVDFEVCKEDGCSKLCESGSMLCSPITCGDSTDDQCLQNPEQSTQ
jgi:hypothetical protein